MENNKIARTAFYEISKTLNLSYIYSPDVWQNLPKHLKGRVGENWGKC